MLLPTLVVLVVYCLHAAQAWKGHAITANDTRTVQTNTFGGVGLSLSVTTTDVNERILLVLNMAVRLSAPTPDLKVSIYRDSTNLVGTFLKRVSKSLEIEPIVASILDVPGGIGTIVYSVQVKGNALISPNAVPRQLMAIVISSNYIYNQAWNSGLIKPPSVASGLTFTISTQSTSRVLLLYSGSMQNSTLGGDGGVNIARGGTDIGTSAYYAFGSAFSSFVSTIDAPSVAGSVSYSVVLTRGAGSTYTMNNDNVVSTFVGLTIPNNQEIVTAITSRVSVVETSWRNILSIDVTPMTGTDKILIMFNADLIFMDPRLTNACFTITRNGIHLGHAMYGITMISSSTQFSRRSPMIMFLDSPKSSASVTYGVSVKSVEGYEFQLGRALGLESSLSVVIVSDTYLTPSVPPTAAPSTRAPTNLPVDCTNGCTIVSSTVSLIVNRLYGLYTLPRYFTFTFDVTVPALTANNMQRFNLFDLVDSSNGVSLLSVYVTESNGLNYFYNNLEVVDYGPALVSIYSVEATTVRISVLPNNVVSIESSGSNGWTATYSNHINVDTTNNIYKLYLSNGGLTAGGAISNAAITVVNGGPTLPPSIAPSPVPSPIPKKPIATLAPSPTPTITPSLYPTFTPSRVPTTLPSYQVQDCRASCSLHTAQVVTIAANNQIDDVYLSPTFSLAFTINRQSLAANSTTTRSILEIINANDQTSLFAISATETAQPRITYGNNVLTEYGPAFNTLYATGGWTTYTLKVYSDRVTLTYSVNVNDVRTYYITSPVDTTNKLYRLYASGPSGLSAGGYVYNILITGLTAVPTAQPTLSPTLQPSLNPSMVPTVAPSPVLTPAPTLAPVDASVVDCRISCTIQPARTITIAAGQLLAQVLLPPRFSVNFYVLAVLQPTVATTSLLNLFEISTASAQLLSFYTSGGRAPTIIYANTQVTSGTGPLLNANYGSVWTTYSIEVRSDRVVMSSNADVNTVTYSMNNVDTVGQIYNIWGSNGYLGTAGGFMYQMTIVAINPDPTPAPTLAPTLPPTRQPTLNPSLPPSRQPTLRPSAQPTLPPTAFPSLAPVAGGILDCTVECVVSGQVVISFENKLVYAYISNHFELTFRVMKQGIQLMNKNILSIYDNLGNLLFCMYASTTQYPVFVYNNQQIMGTGAPFAVDYDNVWTTYTVVVGPTSLTITSSANVNSPVSHTYTSPRVNDNILYKVFASSDFETTAGGYIDAITFKGLTNAPTKAPTTRPSLSPSVDPTMRPSGTPSAVPSIQPSLTPTVDPSIQPSVDPTVDPSVIPTVDPTTQPSVLPSVTPSARPSIIPSTLPTLMPSTEPSVTPSVDPTLAPSAVPSVYPSASPSAAPTLEPSSVPSVWPTVAPSAVPTEAPSVDPTVVPSVMPSELPTVQPSTLPSLVPSASPSMTPSASPSVDPSTVPSEQPTVVPTTVPTALPSAIPSVTPSTAPSAAPSLRPTLSATAAVPVVSLSAEVDTTLPGSKIIVKVTLSIGENAIVRCGAIKSTQILTSVNQIVSQGFTTASSNSAATVVVQGLVPMTTYTVYCATESLFGVVMPLSMVRLHTAKVVTDELKSITVALSVRSVKIGSVTSNALVVTLSHLPKESVNLVLSTSSPESVFYPGQVVFTNTSEPTTTAVVFAAGSVPALNTISIEITGPDADSYQLVYSAGTSIEVLVGSDTPLTPQLDSAAFSSDGSSVHLRFSSPTNKAGYLNAFVCGNLLSFAGSARATCQWQDASTIVIYPSNIGERLQLQSPVSLVATNSIRAQCPVATALSVCSSWSVAGAVTIYVTAPASAASPVLVLSVPVVINSCSSLPVDMSSSSGSGGRAWENPTFTVTSAIGDAFEIAQFLNANFSMRSRTSVPNSKFQDASGNLTIAVQLCNFLGACSSATATVTIDPSTAPIPIVSIPGPSVRSATVSAGLLLTSSAYTLSCNGTQSNRNLRYAWSVLDNGVAVSPEVLRSDSADVSKFRVSPYQLKALHYYTFQLTVTSTITGTVTTASVGVNVVQSVLVAQVAGGATQTIRVDSTLQLDASLSFDPDSRSTELTYMWTCVQSAPIFNATCPLQLNATSAHQAVLQVSAGVSEIGRTATLTVTVSDATRSAQAQVSVTAVESSAPVVSINSAPESLTAINVASRLSLTGTVSTQGACQAMWSADQTSLNLSSIALTPTISVIPNGATRQVNLALLANSLPVRATLTFALTCGQSRSTVVVTTNGPPLPGVFAIEPAEGQEISTSFLFVASLWSDSELPLSYLFGFVSSVSGASQTLLGKSEAAFGSSSLPAGTTEAEYQVSCFVKVDDNLDAASDASATVKVTPNQDSLNLVTAALSESTDNVDAMKNAISLGGAVLNAVNCSSAPNCTALHRQRCQSIAHTCGACEYGYIGDTGSSNAVCIDAAVVIGGRRLTAQSCVSDGDCGEGWEVCDKLTNPLNPVCAVPQKQCPNDCSNRGQCLKINVNSGNSVVDCMVSDASCVAQCQCNEGYGGRDCSHTTEYLQSRQTLRATFMLSLATILRYDDVNIATVSSWSDGLSALTQDPYELSTESASEVSALAQQILATASTVSGFSYENAVGVLNSLSAATASTGYTNNSSVSAALATIARFNDLVASQSVAGQDSVGYYYDAFQLKSVKQFATAGNAIDLTTPTGALQTSATASKVHVSPDTDDELTVSLISTPAASYGDLGNSFNTNPLQLSVTRTSASSTHAIFVLTHNAPVEFTSPQEAENIFFRTNCSGLNDQPLVSSYTCPGSGEVIEHNCTGLSASTLTSYCPVLVPSCAVLNVTATSVDLSSNSSVCVVAAYDAYSTTCNCTITPDTVTLRRRLESQVSQTGVLDVVSASIYLGNEFVDTFDSSEQLATVSGLQRVLIVIIMFSTLWAAGILLILTCTGRRKILEPKHKKTMEKIKEQLQKIEGAKTNSDVKRYLTNYVVEIFPSVFSNKPFFGRLYGEIKRHHRYLTLFTATEGATGDKERILTAVELLSTQTMLMFLLALLYDVQAPTNDGSCTTHHSADSCYQRRSPFDDSQAYCVWQTPGTNTADYYCEYAQPEFSLQIVIYISVIVALLTALIQFPLDACMDLLSAPIADDLKLAEEETAMNKMGRRMSNVARRVSLVASNLTTAAQNKLSSTRKSLVGTLARKIPESTEVAHSLASVSMQLIVESTQRSLRERELNQIRQFRQSGGRYQVTDNAYESDESSSSDSHSDVETGDEENLGQPSSKRLHTRPSQRAVVKEERIDPNAASLTASVVDASMLRLTAEISCQRRLLVEDDRDLFDSQWGLDPTGEFCQGEHSRLPFLFKGKPGAQQLIRGELEFVKSETAKKCDKLRVATDQHTGLEILHLFIMDLLGRRTPAARIFETKAMEDFKHTKVVSKNWKRFAVVALVAINAFFVYYSMLTGFRRGLSWQRMYLIACIIQMVVEITLFETMECVWINCCVPILVSAEVRRVGDSIIEVVQHMCSDEKHIDTSLFLNAPDYLFVSTNVAKKFPALMESIVVQTYINHVPGELAKIWQVGSVARITRHQRVRNATLTATILAALQVLGTAPFVIHRMFVRFSQPFVFSAFVLIWQLIISSVIYIAIAAGLLVLCIAACVYVYYFKPRFSKQNSMEVAPITAQYEDCTPPRQSAASLDAAFDAAMRARTVSYDNVPLNMPVLNNNFEVASLEDEKSPDSCDSSPVRHRKRASSAASQASAQGSRANRLNSLSSEDLSDGNVPVVRLKHGKHTQLSQKLRPRLASDDSIPEEPSRHHKRHHRTPHADKGDAGVAADSTLYSHDLSDSQQGDKVSAEGGAHDHAARRRSRARARAKEYLSGGGHSSEEGSFSHSDSSSDASSD